MNHHSTPEFAFGSRAKGTPGGILLAPLSKFRTDYFEKLFSA
jgi:hypothetical protein